MNHVFKNYNQLIRPSLRIVGVRCNSDIHHPEGHEPAIPSYVPRLNEDIKLKKARLLYQSRKRGMLENGLVLSTFAKKYLETFNDKQLALYDQLINLPSNDWDLFYWAIGLKPTPAEFNHEIMDLLKTHVRNDDRQSRIVQPDLY
ncbi:succinate dehydrogenase assembly factor 2, mitochondrial [Microplitis demolitor]|uniref:succinate dehydrogenase assembly factor 2, mitochondrial n=1 Tax=Microplitis demolitor TaxID=69319 RepID=UPI0004CD6FBD|nr:succinate dehydrogenase assembly factor 2, mitochondrial [Microplitis demolitor]